MYGLVDLLIIFIIVGVLYIATKGSLPIFDQPEQLSVANPEMICPHCQTKGSVTTRQVKRKKGISGGKATAAVLTAGVSMLGTGLSRKQKVTEATCSHCHAVWSYE